MKSDDRRILERNTGMTKMFTSTIVKRLLHTSIFLYVHWVLYLISGIMWNVRRISNIDLINLTNILKDIQSKLINDMIYLKTEFIYL
jgi:hypothetical protein